MIGFLEEEEGVNSSKRLAGLIMVGAGVLAFAVGLIWPDRFDAAKYAGTTLLTAGAAMLVGGNIVERIGQ